MNSARVFFLFFIRVGGPVAHKHNYRLHATLCHLLIYGILCYMLYMFHVKHFMWNKARQQYQTEHKDQIDWLVAYEGRLTGLIKLRIKS